MKKNDAWHNFLYYASKIETTGCRARNIEPNLLPFVSFVVPDHSPILCSLKELMWVEDGLLSDTLLFLIGSMLQTLRIQVRERVNGEDDA